MVKGCVAEVEIKLILTCPVESETDSQVIVFTSYILPTSGTLSGILAPEQLTRKGAGFVTR